MAEAENSLSITRGGKVLESFVASRGKSWAVGVRNRLMGPTFRAGAASY